MKKILVLAGLSLLLAGCNDKDKTTPTASVNLSGTWTSTSVQSGYSSSGTFALAQTSMNAAGDFVATVSDAIGQSNNMGTISGNINSGTLKSVDKSGVSITCTGSFSNNYAKYVGTCPTPGSSPVALTMTKN